MSLLEIIANVRRLCHENRINPNNVKITVEFNHPEDFGRAEYALRSQYRGISVPRYWDRSIVDDIVKGHEVGVVGMKFQVVLPVSAYEMNRRNCNCPYCQSGRPR